MRKLFYSALVGCMLLGVTACSDNDDSSDAGVLPDTLIVKELDATGTTQSPSAVTVNGQADNDGVNDTTWSATFALDGDNDATSLPVDDGTTTAMDLQVVAERNTDGAASYKQVKVTIFEE